MNEFEMPDVIMINGVEYVREDKIELPENNNNINYIMNIRKDDSANYIEIKINDIIIMSINHEHIALYDETDILKKWTQDGYICDNQAVKWNDAEFYLYKGELYCAYNFIGGYKNDEMIYNFKTMKQGDRTQAPVPIWEHSETLKVV
jgi:hypothetical protein